MDSSEVLRQHFHDLVLWDVNMVAWQKGLHNRISVGKAVLSKVEQISLLNDYLEFLYDNVHF